MRQVFAWSFVAVCLVAVMSSTAMAQRGGGRGGFGGGMGLPGLIAMSEVQKEINLSEEKASELTKAVEDLRPRRGQGERNFREMSEEERTKLRKDMEDANSKIEEKIKSTLSAEQWKRLSELRLQLEGPMGLTRDDVAAQLKLTDEQKSKVQKLVGEMRSQMGRRDSGGGRANFEEMQQRREQLSSELLSVLTAEQKETFETLKGEKFDFPERRRSGGNAGSGGARRGRPAAE